MGLSYRTLDFWGLYQFNKFAFTKYEFMTISRILWKPYTRGFFAKPAQAKCAGLAFISKANRVFHNP